MSKKVNKITEEELKSVKEQQTKLNTLLQEIGVLESQKHAALHELASVNEDINVYKKSLEDKYGSVQINLQDGSFEEIENVNN
jgi:predicted  nucleic acid-binding Zn-ribbon protein